MKISKSKLLQQQQWKPGREPYYFISEQEGVVRWCYDTGRRVDRLRKFEKNYFYFCLDAETSIFLMLVRASLGLTMIQATSDVMSDDISYMRKIASITNLTAP